MKRVQAIRSHPDYKTYLMLNEKQEANREFCCHNFQHALDVARIYYILWLEEDKEKALKELANMPKEESKELIYAISLLHDIGRWKQYMDQHLDHAEEGAVLAKPILQDANFSPYEIDLALEAIRAHRNPHAVGLGLLLYRADKLSRNCRDCKVRDKCNKLDRMETRDNLLY